MTFERGLAWCSADTKEALGVRRAICRSKRVAFAGFPFLPLRQKGCMIQKTGGAHSKLSIDPNHLDLLNRGVAESRTHIEEMVIDWAQLLGRTYPDLEFDPATLNRTPFIRRFRLVGDLLREHYGPGLFNGDREWVSDTIRGWHAMAIGGDSRLSTKSKLSALLPYARDHHFAVREWAWLALRPAVVLDPLEALRHLMPIGRSSSYLDRRFASEVLRPRSVWGSHIELFKAKPEMADAFLAQLRCDNHAYVRTSVGNWLNDVATTRPDWLAETCADWLRMCQCQNTQIIVRRGARRLTHPT